MAVGGLIEEPTCNQIASPSEYDYKFKLIVHAVLASRNENPF